MLGRNPVVMAVAILTVFSGCGSDPIAPEGRKRVFVTSASFAGDLGGPAGGDAKCASAAAAAGLGGAFRAWLSDATTDALDRITHPGPWFLVDTTSRVFNSKADLVSQPMVPIIVTETGASLSFGVAVWTGTENDGTTSTATCGNWASTSGTGRIGQVSTNAWTSAAFNNCTTPNRLYCFEL